MYLNYEIRNITSDESVILDLFSIANSNKQNFLPVVNINQEIDFFSKQVQKGKRYYCIFISNAIAGACVLRSSSILQKSFCCHNTNLRHSRFKRPLPGHVTVRGKVE